MKTHIMGLQPEPFEKIKAGTKKIELRLFDEKRKNLAIGDTIEFQKQPEESEMLRARISALLRYESFSKLFDDFPSEVFGGKDKESLLQGVRRFYSSEKEKEYGVLGIKIEPLEE
ncbi:MAG: ASCH domain-containing protein [Candidatus Moranbacteria bacterium]|nr:ASCH domain-containing protein [Candidatus Moranbacteria bacterium]